MDKDDGDDASPGKPTLGEPADSYLKTADELEAFADVLAGKIQGWAADHAAKLRRKAYGLLS